MANPEKFGMLRTVLRAIGLPDAVVEDIIDRIVDFLSSGGKDGKPEVEIAYAIRDDFLSPAERSFYGVLLTVTGTGLVVCPKVALGDLFFAKPEDARQKRILMNRIDRKHVDFLLCKPGTMRPVAGVELDDRSHDRPDRRERDQFVETVFRAAELPLLRFPAQHSYSPTEIYDRLNALFTPRGEDPAESQQATTEPPPVEISASAAPTEAPACPKCGTTMQLRTARSGANAGGQFWGCPNFPKCRSMLPVG